MYCQLEPCRSDSWYVVRGKRAKNGVWVDVNPPVPIIINDIFDADNFLKECRSRNDPDYSEYCLVHRAVTEKICLLLRERV